VFDDQKENQEVLEDDQGEEVEFEEEESVEEIPRKEAIIVFYDPVSD